MTPVSQSPDLREALERSTAQFFFEIGFGSCWAEAFIRNGETPPFPMTDGLVEHCWDVAGEAHEDPEEFDRYLERAEAGDAQIEGNSAQPEVREALERIVHENGPVCIDWMGEQLAWRPLDYGTWTALSSTPAQPEQVAEMRAQEIALQIIPDGFQSVHALTLGYREIAEKAALVALAQAPQQPDATVREKVARIIDPGAWALYERRVEISEGRGRPHPDPVVMQSMMETAARRLDETVADSFAKADAILAALAQPHTIDAREDDPDDQRFARIDLGRVYARTPASPRSDVGGD